MKKSLFFLLLLTGALFFAGCQNGQQRDSTSGATMPDSILLWLQNHAPADEGFRLRLINYAHEHPGDYFRQQPYIRALVRQGSYIQRNNESDSIILALQKETLGHRLQMDPCVLASLANSIGAISMVSGFYDSAAVYYNLAISFAQTCKNDTAYALSLMGLGNVNYQTTQYKKALAYYREALALAGRLHDSELIQSVCGNKANVYMDLKDYGKSIPLYKATARYAIAHGDYQTAVTANCVLFNCYIGINDTLACLHATDETLALLDSIPDNLYAQFNGWYSYGYVLCRFGRCNEALHCFDKSIRAIQVLGNEFYANHCRLGKAEALIKLKRFAEARDMLIPILKYAASMHDDPTFENDGRNLLARAQEGLGKYQEALKLTNRYYEVKDSIGNRENAVQIARMESEFEQKERSAQLQSQQQELASLKKDKSYLLLFLLLAITITLLVILVLNVQRKRVLLKKENILKEQFNRELIAATERERARIAQELHDGIASDLLLIKVAGAAGGQIERVINNIRDITQSLFPVHLSKVKLAGALTSLVEMLDRETEIYFALTITNEAAIKLSREQELYAFRIAQEALNNIVKHAHAKAVLVVLGSDGHEVSLLIRDNGVGFNEKMQQAATQGMGITFMRQRAAHIKTLLEIKSKPGDGCTVHLRIPMI